MIQIHWTLSVWQYARDPRGTPLNISPIWKIFNYFDLLSKTSQAANKTMRFICQIDPEDLTNFIVRTWNNSPVKSRLKYLPASFHHLLSNCFQTKTKTTSSKHLARLKKWENRPNSRKNARPHAIDPATCLRRPQHANLRLGTAKVNEFFGFRAPGGRVGICCASLRP